MSNKDSEYIMIFYSGNSLFIIGLRRTQPAIVSYHAQRQICRFGYMGNQSPAACGNYLTIA